MRWLLLLCLGRLVLLVELRILLEVLLKGMAGFATRKAFEELRRNGQQGPRGRNADKVGRDELAEIAGCIRRWA